jgi:hypothetical protein
MGFPSDRCAQKAKAPSASRRVIFLQKAAEEVIVTGIQ